MSQIVFVYIPCPTMDEAKALAKSAIDAHLAACANILPGMVSLYRWEKKLEMADEVVLLLKTATTKVDDLQAHIKTHHSYKLPCIARINVDHMNPEYRNWLLDELA